LESLLASSDYDYVLRASASHPDKIEAVVLMARNLDAQDIQATPVPEGLVMTPARSAWVESLKANRHSGGAEDEEASASTPLQRTEPEENSKQPRSEASAEKTAIAPADSAQTLNNPAASLERPAGTPNEDAGAADASAAPTPSNLVQSKITSMEQLFEQRKQMMDSQAPAPKP
jgi:hypothetical protein